MNDKARELLGKVVSNLYQHDDILYGTVQEIRAFLFTPEPEQDEEPFGYVSEHTTGGYYFHRKHSEIYWDTCVVFHKVFLHPAPQKFVRLSEEEMQKVVRKTGICWDVARAIEDALEAKNQ